METRNVPTGYLAPLGRKGSPRNASMPHQQGRGGYSPAVFHEHLTPKAISQYKTAKMLQSIGQKAIFSNNPYVDTAVETLIHKGPGASNSPGEGPPPPEQEYSSSPRRPVAGKLPRKGAKAAAMKRAKRLVGAGAAFTPEVSLMGACAACHT